MSEKIPQTFSIERRLERDDDSRKWLKALVEAHTDLNMFAAVVAMLEGSIVSVSAQPDEFKVIALCQKAQLKCLRRYDRALKALTKGKDR